MQQDQNHPQLPEKFVDIQHLFLYKDEIFVSSGSQGEASKAASERGHPVKIIARVFPVSFPLSVLLFAVISLGVSSGSPRAQCSSRLFGADTGMDQMLRIDPATGQATVMAPFNFGSVASTGLTFDENGVLWGAFRNEVGDYLVHIDTETGAISTVVQLDRNFEGRGIEFTDDGRLFLVDDLRQFWEINPLTGESTFVTNLAFHTLSLANSLNSDLLFTVDLLRDVLVLIDLAGNVMDVGALNLGFANNIISLADCPEGSHSLYGVDGRNDLLIFIDPETGSAITIGDFGLGVPSGVGGLAFEPVATQPEVEISPAGAVGSSGLEGGPFTPASHIFQLENISQDSVDYSASFSMPWLSFRQGGVETSSVDGSIAPGESVSLDVLINEDASLLMPGDYTAEVLFDISGASEESLSRIVNLTIGELAIELLTNGDFESGDLSGWEVTQEGSAEILLQDGGQNPPGPEGPVPPCSGQYSALTAQSGSSYHRLAQLIEVPSWPAEVTLSWTHSLANSAFIFDQAEQRFLVRVTDEEGQLIREVFTTTPESQSSPECLIQMHDLSDLRGQAIYVEFLQISNLGYFNVLLDDASLIASGINHSPHAIATAPGITQCSSPGGGRVLLDGSESWDPDGDGQASDIASYQWFSVNETGNQTLLGSGAALELTLPLGEHQIELLVTDFGGLSSSVLLMVSVVDTAPPSLTVQLGPQMLWPPNHRMIDITAEVQAVDVCGPAQIRLESLSSSEEEDIPGGGDGKTSPDIDGGMIGTDDRAFRFRAERDGAGPGRVYTARYSATDAAGNVSVVDQHSWVPLNSSLGNEPLILNVVESESGTDVSWAPVPQALMYHVLRGSVGSLSDQENGIILTNSDCMGAVATHSEPMYHESVELLGTGDIHYYLVSYDTFEGNSGFGTESSAKPRLHAGSCGEGVTTQ